MIVAGEDHRTDRWNRANSGTLNFIFRNYVELYANYFHRVCSVLFASCRYFVNEGKQVLILGNRR